MSFQTLHFFFRIRARLFIDRRASGNDYVHDEASVCARRKFITASIIRTMPLGHDIGYTVLLRNHRKRQRSYCGCPCLSHCFRGRRHGGTGGYHVINQAHVDPV